MTAGEFSEKNLPHHYYAKPKTSKNAPSGHRAGMVCQEKLTEVSTPNDPFPFWRLVGQGTFALNFNEVQISISASP